LTVIKISFEEIYLPLKLGGNWEETNLSQELLSRQRPSPDVCLSPFQIRRDQLTIIELAENVIVGRPSSYVPMGRFFFPIYLGHHQSRNQAKPHATSLFPLIKLFFLSPPKLPLLLSHYYNILTSINT